MGQVSSAAYGHGVGRAVAMGYVERPGEEVETMVAGGGFELEIACERFGARASFDAPLKMKTA